MSIADFLASLDGDIARLERWIAAARLANHHDQETRLCGELRATREIRERALRIADPLANVDLVNYRNTEAR